VFLCSYVFCSTCFEGAFEHVVESIGTTINTQTEPYVSPELRENLKTRDGLVQDEHVCCGTIVDIATSKKPSRAEACDFPIAHQSRAIYEWHVVLEIEVI
jgi:hypothetical protein